MNAAKVVVFDDDSARTVDGQRVSRAIPANHESIFKLPRVRATLPPELGVRSRELIDAIQPLASDRSTAELQQKLAIDRRHRTVLAFERVNLRLRRRLIANRLGQLLPREQELCGRRLFHAL